MGLVRMCVLVGVLVRVFTGYRVIVRVLVVALTRMRVSVCMGVAMRVLRPMRVLRMRVAMRCLDLERVGVVRALAFADQHIHLGSSDSAAAHFAHLETRAHVQRRSRLDKRVEGDTRIHKGA